MRDDIKNATDFARVITEEVPHNVIPTPQGGMLKSFGHTDRSREGQRRAVEILAAFQTAEQAAQFRLQQRTDHNPREVMDFLLINEPDGENIESIRKAAEKGADEARFRKTEIKQTTFITPLDEGAPA